MIFEVGDIVKRWEMDWEDRYFVSYHLILEVEGTTAVSLCLETGEIRWRIFEDSDYCTNTKVA